MNPKFTKAALLSAIFVSCMNGCNKKNVVAGPSELDVMIDKNISETQRFVRSITREDVVAQADSERSMDNEVDPRLLPAVLKKELKVKWYGDAQVVLESITDKMEGSVFFLSKGIKPSHPHDVFINESKKSFYAILQDVGNQLPSDVVLEVIIDPMNKERVRIEIEYNAK